MRNYPPRCLVQESYLRILPDIAPRVVPEFSGNGPGSASGLPSAHTSPKPFLALKLSLRIVPGIAQGGGPAIPQAWRVNVEAMPSCGDFTADCSGHSPEGRSWDLSGTAR